MSDHPELAMSPEQIENMVDLVQSPNGEAHDPSEAVARNKAVRAIGFLEGFGALLWTQVGPNLADEEVAEFEKRVADIAAYIGLPPREVDAE